MENEDLKVKVENGASENEKEEQGEEKEEPTMEEQSEEKEEPTTEEQADEALGVELFEKALDWTVTGKFARRQEGRKLVDEMVRTVVSRSIKKVTMSQTVLDFVEDKEELDELDKVRHSEGEEEDIDWNKRLKEESARRSTGVQVRHCLIQKVYQLKDQGVVIGIRNLLLQRKVAEISIGRRVSPGEKQKDTGLRAFSALGVDPKVRYHETLTQYGELRKTLDDLKQRYEKELRVLREYKDTVEQHLQEEMEKLRAVFRTEVAQLYRGPSGKFTEGEELLALVERKLLSMSKEHIRFVQTSQRLKDTTRRITTLEMYGKDTKLEDYEQLFEDNQKLEERLEERGEVIVALREKAVHELQEAAHMRDMMHGTEEDVEALVLQLETVEERLARGRDAVARAKRRRDEVRRATVRLVDELELLAFPELLSHFQKLRKLRAHAERWLRSLVRACSVQEEGIRRVRASLLELSKQYRGIIPDAVLRMLENQSRDNQMSHVAVIDESDDDAEVEAPSSRFTFNF